VNEILKQRLVGALILLALGVVFWPIIFVQPDHRQVADQPSIPPPPAVVTEPIATPDASGLRASPPTDAIGSAIEPTTSTAQESAAAITGETASSHAPDDTASPAVDPAATPLAQTTRQEPPQKLEMDSDGVPVAWTLQVATVSAADKAAELRNKLLDMNQKAYVATVTSGGKTLYRVCIGPKFERVELEKLQAGINAKFGVNTMVVRYVP
jgi:DedD protein